MSSNARSAASGGSQVSAALAWLSRFRVALLPFASIVALVIYFTAVNPLFFSASNALNIGRQSSVLLLVSLAETVVILIGSIDLSVGALVTLTGILTALTVDTLGAFGGGLVGVAAGAFVGLANGLLVTMLRVPSFLVTLGMLSILSGVTNQISQGQSILFANTLLRTGHSYTITIWLADLTGGQRAIDWGAVMAASTLISIPVVIFFLLVQRKIAYGLTAGAVRG